MDLDTVGFDTFFSFAPVSWSKSEKPCWLILCTQRLAKNPLFEVISLNDPTGPYSSISVLTDDVFVIVVSQ